MQRAHFLALILPFYLATTSQALATPPLANQIVRHPERKDAQGGLPLAKMLFLRGKQHMSKNEYRSACPLLEESVRLDPAILSKFALTKCHYQMERYARAFELLLDIQATAKAPADVKRAREIAATVTPKIGKLTVALPPASMRPKGIEIYLDGARLDDDAWQGSEPATRVLDIGEHVVLATAPGKVPWRQAFHVTAHDKPITIHVPRLADELPEPAPVKENESRTSNLVLPLAGLGVLTFATGVGVGIVGIEHEKQRADLFVPLGACLAIGGVAMAGSVLLWPGKSKSTQAPAAAAIPLRFVPVAGPGRAFGAIQGSF